MNSDAVARKNLSGTIRRKRVGPTHWLYLGFRLKVENGKAVGREYALLLAQSNPDNTVTYQMSQGGNAAELWLKAEPFTQRSLR